MMTTEGMFFFKFSSKDEMDAMIKKVPCLIRKVKFHNIPITVFKEDGLSVILTKLGTPLMLDPYNSAMCTESWGRSSYAKTMFELQADIELKDTLVIVVPINYG
ncbi:hypothetical protein Tco_1397194 [Tanacetum coccineum]